MTPMVSILIPAFNAEKWITDAVKSSLDQTWENKEVVIVDDGSSDHTYKIAKRFESRIVKVIRQDNLGASAARNKALSYAQGDYIQWLDADDILAPEKISYQLKNLETILNSKILLSSAWGMFYFRPKKAQFVPNLLWNDMDPVEWIYRKIRDNTWMSIESWLVSRELTILAGPWDERLSRDDDGEYFCRVVSASDSIKFIKEAVSYCRRGNLQSISSNYNKSEKFLNSQFQSICLHIQYLLALEDSERTRLACLNFLQRWLEDFYFNKPEICEKMMNRAIDLGGELQPPSLPWISPIANKLFGWEMAKRVAQVLPAMELLFRKNVDKLLYYISNEKL